MRRHHRLQRAAYLAAVLLTGCSGVPLPQLWIGAGARTQTQANRSTRWLSLSLQWRASTDAAAREGIADSAGPLTAHEADAAFAIEGADAAASLPVDGRATTLHAWEAQARTAALAALPLGDGT